MNMDGARSFKVVFPHIINHHNAMFGGDIISIMVQVPFMTTTRFTRQRLVIVAVERIDFAKPIPAGTIVGAVGSIDIGDRYHLTIPSQMIVNES